MTVQQRQITRQTLAACAVAMALCAVSQTGFAQEVQIPTGDQLLSGVHTKTDLKFDKQHTWGDLLLGQTALTRKGTATAQNNSLTILLDGTSEEGTTSPWMVWGAMAVSFEGSAIAQNNAITVLRPIGDTYGAIAATPSKGEGIKAVASSNSVNLKFDQEFTVTTVAGGTIGAANLFVVEDDSEDSRNLLQPFAGSFGQANSNTVTIDAKNLSVNFITGGQITVPVGDDSDVTLNLQASGNRVSLVSIKDAKTVAGGYIATAAIESEAEETIVLRKATIVADNNTVEVLAPSYTEALSIADTTETSDQAQTDEQDKYQNYRRLAASYLEIHDTGLDADIQTVNNRSTIKSSTGESLLWASRVVAEVGQGRIVNSGNVLVLEDNIDFHSAEGALSYGTFATEGSIVADNNSVIVKGVKPQQNDGGALYGVGIEGENLVSAQASENTMTVSQSNLDYVNGQFVDLGGTKTATVNLFGNAIFVEEKSTVDKLYATQVHYKETGHTIAISGNTVSLKDTTVTDTVVGIYVGKDRTNPENGEQRTQTPTQDNTVLTITDNHIVLDHVTVSEGSESKTEAQDSERTPSYNVYVAQIENKSTFVNNSLTLIDSHVTGEVGTVIYTVTVSENGGEEKVYKESNIQNNRLNFVGVNTVGGLGSYKTMALYVGEENLKAPVVTLKGIKSSSQQLLTTKPLTSEPDDVIEIYAPYGLDKDYQLIATEDTSRTYEFNDINLVVNTAFYTQSTKASFTLDGTVQNSSLSAKDEVVVQALAKASKVANGNAKTLAETLLGTVAFVQQGAEFIADDGLAAMDTAATADALTAFGAMHGGTNKYLTGSDVEVDGVTLATGIATKVGDHTLAAFVEAGWAESDSHVAGTKAEGDHDYFGVGVASRLHLTDAVTGDMSLRLGRSTTKYQGVFATDVATYDSSVYYATAHAGLGFDMPITDNWTANVDGRYSLSFVDGDDLTLTDTAKSKFEMGSTVTHAVRIGTRVKGEVTENIALNAGLAYEHVFNGKASSSVAGVAIDEPALKGDTGILEIGMMVKPSATSPWSVNFGAKGYAGDRQGVSGNLSATYRF